MHFGPGSPAFKNMQNQRRLVDGGISYPESAAAIEAAKAEGREVGSVAEERARAAQRKAAAPTPRPVVHKTLAKLPGATDGPHVLFIEGFGMADFMAGSLLGLPSDIPGVPTSQEAKVAWRGMTIKRISCVVEMELSDLAAEVCRLELASGAYHAVVVVDLAQDHGFFETELGGAVQAFVRGGGAVAFPTSEGLQLASVMAHLFDTTWERSGYYRTSWGAAEENREHVRSTLGDRLASGTFSAKACSLRKVPPHERCFGVTDQSRTQSLVPFMAGQDVSKGDEPDSVTADSAAMASDYDVCVATHQFGTGAVAFFGDVNCEGRTSELVAAFVAAAAEEAPVAAWAIASKLQLDADAYASAMQAKSAGSTAFGGGPTPQPSSLRAGFLSGGGLRGPSENYDEDDDDEDYDDEDEIGPYGFTHEEEMELLSQGVKPWEDDAHAVLDALRGDN